MENAAPPVLRKKKKEDQDEGGPASEASQRQGGFLERPLHLFFSQAPTWLTPQAHLRGKLPRIERHRDHKQRTNSGGA